VLIIEQSAGVEPRDKWKSQKLSVMLRRGPGPLFDGEKRKRGKGAKDVSEEER